MTNLRPFLLGLVWALVPLASRADTPVVFWKAAWDAASAITNDPQDQAKWQMRVVLAGADLGISAEELEGKARSIEGWRKWATLAEVAMDLVPRGQTNEAQRLALEALYKAPLFKEDEHDRILQRALWALGALGDAATAEDYAQRYAGPGRTAEEVRAARALARALNGDVESARRFLEETSSLRGDDGIILRARMAVLVASRADASIRDAWADTAWERTAQIRGYRRIDERLSLLRELRGLLDPERARMWTEKTAEDVAVEQAPAFVRALQWADLGAAWARAGVPDRARVCAGEALALADKADWIEQPVIRARAALALYLADEKEKAKALWDQSLEQASQLVNLRPRCIALARVRLTQAEAAMME